MYCPTHFAETRLDVLLECIEQFPLATIVSSGQSGLVADHVPLMYEPASGTAGRLVGHVAKNNPLWRAHPDQEYLLIFQGPSAYISPNWYATKPVSGKVVPTWNYAVVHVTATLTACHEPDALLAVVTKLTARHESAQAIPWRVADAPPEFIENLLANIVGVEFRILHIRGKWKVSQNQPLENRRGVVAGLRALSSESADHMARLVEQSAAGTT